MKHLKAKNMLSILVVCVMLLCSVTAFASPKDEFNKLSTQEITKAAFTYDFGIKLNEPLSAALDETGEISAVLGNLMFHAYGKMDMSDDYQQMKMQMTMEMLALQAFMLIPKAFTMVIIVGLCRSGGDTLFACILDTATVWVVAVPLAFLGANLGLPLWGVYLCVCSEDVVKAILGVPRILSKKWLHNVVADIA